MNVRMVDAAVDTIREVDVLGLVVDVSEPPGKGDQFVLDLVKDAQRAGLPDAQQDRSGAQVEAAADHRRGTAQMGLFAEIVPISAATGDNVDRLERLIIDRLPEGEPLYPADYLTDQPERFFAAEIVREKLLQFTHAEIPFSSAVVIDRFEEPDRPKRPAAPVLHDRGRSGVAEADRRRQGRRHDQADRHGGARGARAVLRTRGVSRPPRPGEERVARGRAGAADDRPRADRERFVIQL